MKGRSHKRWVRVETRKISKGTGGRKIFDYRSDHSQAANSTGITTHPTKIQNVSVKCQTALVLSTE